MASCFRLTSSLIFAASLLACASTKIPNASGSSSEVVSAGQPTEALVTPGKTTATDNSEAAAEIVLVKVPAIILPAELQKKLDEIAPIISNQQMDVTKQKLKAIASEWPDYPQPPLSLAALSIQQKNIDQAKEWLVVAANKSEMDHSSLNSIGIAYRKLGEFAKAETFYLASIDAAPGYPLAQLNLGILYELYLFQIDKALSHYNQHQKLLSEPDPLVAGWIKDIEARLQRVKAQEVSQ